MREGAQKIVIVEDDVKLADMLANYLQANGFATIVVSDGALAVPAVERHAPQAIILDIELPNRNGIDICRALRSFCGVPIMMITARVEEIDRVIGLEVGADDYVCKPFSPREVLARLHALLRRSEGRVIRTVEDCGFRIVEATQRITWQEQDLHVTPGEFRILNAMLSRAGNVFSRELLLNIASDEFSEGTDRTIDTHIKNLRRKLSLNKVTTIRIESVYGSGYRCDCTPSTDEER
jgi:two-component system, OmpR family, response regulator BaeR